MTYNQEIFPTLESGTVAAPIAAIVKGLQPIVAETADYSKKAFDDGAEFLENLRHAKSLEAAIRIQSDYAKSTYEAFTAKARTISALYSDLGKEAFGALQVAIAKVQSPNGNAV
jgi:hypothetical protein